MPALQGGPLDQAVPIQGSARPAPNIFAGNKLEPRHYNLCVDIGKQEQGHRINIMFEDVIIYEIVGFC